ncbi:cytochrome c [Rhizobiales bacterium]|uniref:c-type cytochrome n=1 Tax=Hongsoonwoonella zoysiae TaxID=2821844 RepID=UPI001561800D|nr:cytochrome c [Hongsoonwoonella zoysiae]NRG18795.1 cytochrome c [Hongsoonwoonella zoysiae]
MRILLLIGIAAIVLAVLRFGFEKPDDGKATPGGAIVSVRIPELTGRAEAGQKLFSANCAVCHGENAAGRDGMGPPLVHKIYEPGHHADGAFYLAVARGARAHHWPFGDMPPIEGLTQDNIAKIVDYVRTLQRANGIS